MENATMQIIPFEELGITTMTMIMSLTTGVNVEAAFQLLPITRIAIYQTRESAKCKLPHCEIPGAILSMRYRENVRGVIRSKLSPFKNAVTIDISTVKKNISLKLSSFSIQMCGASSRADGVEAATHVLNHLIYVQNILDRVQNDRQGALDAIDWVKNVTRGDVTEKPHWTEHQFNNLVVRVYRPIICHNIVKPIVNIQGENPGEVVCLIPQNLDKYVVMFLLYLCDDFIYHEDMCLKLDFIPNIQKIIDGPVSIEEVHEAAVSDNYYLALQHVDEAMVNYNYSLGFKVDRELLNLYIDQQYGFISRFNNALATSVTIELPYDPPVGTSIKRRKNKIPHHTFLVYQSGSVTQSGPGGTLMRDAYYLFMNIISQLKPYIEYGSELYREHYEYPVKTVDFDGMSHGY